MQMGTSTWELFPQSDSLFSTSLPVLSHNKFGLNELKHDFQSVDDASMKKNLENGDNNEVGNLLPDDENELLAGMMDDYDIGWLPSLVDESEEYDLFGSGGGLELELESDSQEKSRIGLSNLSISDDSAASGLASSNLTNGVNGEHPLGEHPSRTLFVRNINSNVEDAELKTLFEQFGDIRTLYTACKHRGFVMISYYDIRAARSAMRSLQNKPLRRRKLDIHFSIPKENPSDKDINQGTLVVFNLDPSVSNDDLRQIFGAYGEVKEIRETPHKRHHKFIEFYDVRAAESALKCLNRRDIAGKRIKLEPSRPGGARRSLLQNINHDLEQDERNLHQVGSHGNSPSGNWPQFGSPMDRNSMHSFGKSPVFSSLSPPLGSSLPGLASVLQPQDCSRLEHVFSNGYSNSREIFEQSHSFPEKMLLSQFTGSSTQPFSWGTQTTRQNPFIPFDNRVGYFHESPKISFMSHSFGNMGSRGALNSAVVSRKSMENDSPVFSVMSSPRESPMFLGNGHFSGNFEGLAEFGRPRRVESTGVYIDNKKLFQIDLDKIRSGEDTRTTLMIKNIPNKYTSKMLLATIDEYHRGTYDFLYLPIDFKNKCNVGYAFINMLSPSTIIPFYEAFNGRKWEKFNSEKVAYLAFARIQGKTALVSHFQNSSLMNEDKRCRPILFTSERPELNNRR
ncbi:hypothetical protein ABFS82_13G088800 [Erythranthe guttata]|uniref:RRM domain-containing protein n=1 Tax=Erythranthe guttata TaxID=4155 RepID=A0A022QHJ0_ERYGU|nr:PREDICTED: protein MEI2-like 5 [Erythranthe guttata]EYU28167.1 hypothetical protein MIMGU_mgv1a002426mg [Erythranthe guttata]|eukprot:XP_012848918.1 PREDICTED: protein MEI2-like 5 [Erythranthe guttata]